MSLEPSDRAQLLGLARQSVEQSLTDGRLRPIAATSLSPALAQSHGSFVTLRLNEDLRGCCGSLHATRPLAEDVWRNAWASAFCDPRFMPLEPDEWPQIHLHISVLSPMEAIDTSSEYELIDLLRPNIDGIVLERDDTRATFLPAVWEQVPDPTEFIRHLKQKAGWPAYGWSPLIKVWRYTTEDFGEKDEA